MSSACMCCCRHQRCSVGRTNPCRSESKTFWHRFRSDTEKVVAQTRTRFNSAVRQMLRQETGLRLARSKDSEDEDKETHAIRVFVEPGVPVELQNLLLDDDKWLAILIAPWRSQLERLQGSSIDVRTNLIGSLPQDLVCEGQFAGIGLKLNDVASFAEHLLKIAAQFDLVKELHAVDDDILGQYRWVHEEWSNIGQHTSVLGRHWIGCSLPGSLGRRTNRKGTGT